MFKFLFGGRMARLPYAFVAIPISLILVNDAFVVFLAMKAWELVGNLLNTSKISLAELFSAMLFVFTTLIVILVVASLKRLRDTGLTSWLAAPVLLRAVVLAVMAYLKYQASTYGTPISDVVHQGLGWASQGVRWYELALVFILLLVPGRHKPLVPAETASAF